MLSFEAELGIPLASKDDDTSTSPKLVMQRQISKSGFSGERSTNNMPQPVNVLMVGSGEYTTGYVDGKASDSDKGAGVVALTMFDLRRRGKVDHLAIAGKDQLHDNTVFRSLHCRSSNISIMLVFPALRVPVCQILSFRSYMRLFCEASYF